MNTKPWHLKINRRVGFLAALVVVGVLVVCSFDGVSPLWNVTRIFLDFCVMLGIPVWLFISVCRLKRKQAALWVAVYVLLLLWLWPTLLWELDSTLSDVRWHRYLLKHNLGPGMTYRSGAAVELYADVNKVGLRGSWLGHRIDIKPQYEPPTLEYRHGTRIPIPLQDLEHHTVWLEGFLKVHQDGKSLCIDFQGNAALERAPETQHGGFDDIDGCGTEDLIRVRSGGRTRFVHPDGTRALAEEFERAGPFIVVAGSSWLPQLRPQTVLAAVCHNARCGHINTQGKWLSDKAFEDVTQFSISFEDRRPIVAAVKEGNKWGLIDIRGKLLLPCLYNSIVVSDFGFMIYARREADWVWLEFKDAKFVENPVTQGVTEGLRSLRTGDEFPFPGRQKDW